MLFVSVRILISRRKIMCLPGDAISERTARYTKIGVSCGENQKNSARETFKLCQHTNIAQDTNICGRFRYSISSIKRQAGQCLQELQGSGISDKVRSVRVGIHTTKFCVNVTLLITSGTQTKLRAKTKSKSQKYSPLCQ